MLTVRNPRRTRAHRVVVQARAPRGYALRRSGRIAQRPRIVKRIRALRPGKARTFVVRVHPRRRVAGRRCLAVAVHAVDTRPVGERRCTRGV